MSTPWSKTRGTSYAKAIEKDFLLVEILCATDVPHKVVTHFTTKSKLATPERDFLSSCQVELKERSKSCTLFIRGMSTIFCRVMAVKRETSIFSQGAMAYSFAYFANHMERCPDFPTSSRYPPSANEGDEDYVDYEALVDRVHHLQDLDESDQHLKA